MGHEQIVRILCYRRDVDINSLDRDGYSPSDWAASRGHHSTIKALGQRESLVWVCWVLENRSGPDRYGKGLNGDWARSRLRISRDSGIWGWNHGRNVDQNDGLSSQFQDAQSSSVHHSTYSHDLERKSNSQLRIKSQVYLEPYPIPSESYSHIRQTDPERAGRRRTLSIESHSSTAERVDLEVIRTWLDNADQRSVNPCSASVFFSGSTQMKSLLYGFKQADALYPATSLIRPYQEDRFSMWTETDWVQTNYVLQYIHLNTCMPSVHACTVNLHVTWFG